MIKVIVDLSEATKEEMESYLSSDLRNALMSRTPIPTPGNWNGLTEFLTIQTINPSIDCQTGKYITVNDVTHQ
ncbi:hypothetical protein I2494_18025 [Budviciaceae bacterium BWR-B9]|uniref:XRE family transcriptional regulator n=1 Tax=Limnobaculum allomyrinae TaxID=2791986 RepID=A0ABS1IUZ2_9GAMM|nr:MULTISPECIES: hypothetical protein [Limnobaculum]MBK5145580.1 hypothetical protein [Limnobaculum allomyrinae]MBV7693698.1 hypothetical protein [Limnobaculum sp. M2-1]